MTTWGVTLRAALVATALVASCSGGDDTDAVTATTERDTTTAPTTTSTAPERPASTTTTMYDPAAVEGQVEAAYLKSWDVYADAVYNLELDEEALAEVFAGEYLTTVRDEIEGRIRDGRAARAVVEHHYEIQITGADSALLVDRYTNHQVLIDPSTKRPVEADPNEAIVDAYEYRRIDGVWLAVDLDRLA